MGDKKGVAEVRRQDGSIVLRLLGGDNPFSGRFVPEYAFQMSGTLKTPLSELPASLRGSVTEDGLRAVLETEQGSFPIEGAPLAEPDESQKG